MPENTEKICTSKRRPSCEQYKPLSAFVKAAKRPDGRDNVCAECRAGARRENYDSSKRRTNHLSLHYGLTPEAYELMRQAQNYRCAACGRHEDELPTILAGRPRVDGTAALANPPLVVDHDHETGEVRGLVCVGCNSGIGHMGDDPQRLRSAAQYLENHSGSGGAPKLTVIGRSPVLPAPWPR